MANWGKVSSLLAKEMALWEQIEAKNRTQIQCFVDKNNSLEGIEQYLEEKDALLEALVEVQIEMDNMKISVEQDKTWAEEALHQEIINKTKQLVDLQAGIVQQEKTMKQYFRRAGDELREQIRAFREKRAMNSSYNTAPILEESILLDKKQ